MCVELLLVFWILLVCLCRLCSFRLFLCWIFLFSPVFSSVVVLVSFFVFVFVLSYVHWFFFFGVVCVCVRVPAFFDAGFLFYLLLVCVFFLGFSGFCLLRVWMG